METNCAAQICYSSNIPFIGVRVISDNIINGEEYNPNVADISQKFALAMAEKYINDVLNK